MQLSHELKEGTVEPAGLKCVLLVECNGDDADKVSASLHQLHVLNPVRRVDNAEDLAAYMEGNGFYTDRTQFPYPAVIVLTLRLPNLDSTRVQYWLRGSPAHRTVPVVVISSKEDLNALKSAVHFGAVAYMTKPFSPLEFDCVRNVLKLALNFGAAISNRINKEATIAGPTESQMLLAF